MDSEDVFYPEEVEKLRDDVQNAGLGLIVFAEWYNAKTAQNFKFFDDNTRSWWTPASGGGNIPGLNTLLSEFGIAFGDAVLKGTQSITANRQVKYLSGSNIVHFPAGGYLHAFSLEDSAAEESVHDTFNTLGLTESDEGRIAVYGDSNCLDSSYQSDQCYDLLEALLHYVNHEKESDLLSSLLNEEQKILTPLLSEDALPEPMEDVDFSTVSFVLSHPLQCYKNSPSEDNSEPEELFIKEDREQEEKQEAGRNVNELLDVMREEPDERSELVGQTSEEAGQTERQWHHVLFDTDVMF